MNNQRFLSSFVYIAALLIILSGCAELPPPGSTLLQEKAVLTANEARSFNQHIIASKGTGFITLETKTKSDRLKIAWAAIFPNKIRLTFLMSGLPVETIVANGEKITFISHTGEHSKHSFNSKDPDMERYIHVPVKLSEMILVLLGRFPIKEFDDAWFSPSDSSSPVITLKKDWKNMTQTLQFNSHNQLDRLESTNYAGSLLYEITVEKYKTYDFGQIPVKLEIKDTGKQKLMLQITNFQANPSIKDSVFQLTE